MDALGNRPTCRARSAIATTTFLHGPNRDRPPLQSTFNKAGILSAKTRMTPSFMTCADVTGYAN